MLGLLEAPAGILYTSGMRSIVSRSRGTGEALLPMPVPKDFRAAIAHKERLVAKIFQQVELITGSHHTGAEKASRLIHFAPLRAQDIMQIARH